MDCERERVIIYDSSELNCLFRTVSRDIPYIMNRFWDEIEKHQVSIGEKPHTIQHYSLFIAFETTEPGEIQMPIKLLEYKACNGEREICLCNAELLQELTQEFGAEIEAYQKKSLLLMPCFSSR